MKPTSSKQRTIIINETHGRLEDKNETGGEHFAEADDRDDQQRQNLPLQIYQHINYPKLSKFGLCSIINNDARNYKLWLNL